MCTHNCNQGRTCQFPCPTKPIDVRPPTWVFGLVVIALALASILIGLVAGYYS